MPELAAALLLASLGASAQEPTYVSTTPAVVESTAPRTTQEAAGGPHSMWFKQHTALLYKNLDGNIENELPLTHSEETGGARAVVHDVSGEVSSNGRFAYTFDKNEVWNTSKTKLLERRRTLRVYGSNGQLLWESPNADAPDGQAPLLFSADGEIALVLLRRDKGWVAALRDYLGATLMEIGPYPKIDEAALTANGRYAMIRWLVPDQDSEHTFIDVKKKTRKDIPSGDLYMGQADIDGDGKVSSGKKIIFDFSAPPAQKDEKKP